MNTQRKTRQHARKRQEGSVILIVLLVVMMTGGLSMFAAQSATFESRALGSTRQVQRLRRAGEGFLVAVESYLAERSLGGGNGLIEPADRRWTDSALQSYRDAYGLPSYMGDTSLYQVRPEGFTGQSFPLRTYTSLPTNELSAGAVSPFVFDGIALIEMHELPADVGQGIGQNAGMAAGQKAYRACTTVYTRMSLPGAGEPGADPRAMHESVGVARAYFELR